MLTATVIQHSISEVRMLSSASPWQEEEGGVKSHLKEVAGSGQTLSPKGKTHLQLSGARMPERA